MTRKVTSIPTLRDCFGHQYTFLLSPLTAVKCQGVRLLTTYGMGVSDFQNKSELSSILVAFKKSR